MSASDAPNAPRRRLPVNPSPEHLKKQAKRRAKADGIALAEAQHRLAGEYGCRNWAELARAVDALRAAALDEKALLAPVLQAAERGDVGAVAILLDTRPSLLTPALWPPAIFQAGSVDLVRMLLDRGLDPNLCIAPRKPLHLAADRGLIDILKLLLDRGARTDVVDGENITPYELVCCGLAMPPNVGAVRQLFRDRGVTDNVFTHIYLGHDDAAVELLRNSPELLDARGPIGFTPLQTAARAARRAVVGELLHLGVAADSPADSANTPLWLACQSNADAADRLAVVALLLERGANPRRECENKTTPLHLAASRGPIAMVELLLRHNAKEWQRDADGKLPRNYAAEGVAPDREAIVELLTRPVIRDPHFKAAVAAIHSGDTKTLAALLKQHPNLSQDRATEPDCYPPGYFGDPKLLWFTAWNPTLTPTIPPNIVDLAATIIDAGVDGSDLSYTLGLVMTSGPMRLQGFREPMMRLLLQRGATIAPVDIAVTLGHGERDAIEFLLARGVPITAPIAAGLGRTDALPALLASASKAELHAALSMAVINEQTEAARLCLDAGADVNAFVAVHTHATPAHLAAGQNDVATLHLLVERGADLTIRDRLWHGTPLGWAGHEGKTEAAELLRSLGAK